VRTYFLLAGLAVLSAGFAPAPFPREDNSKDDLKKIQGTWDRLTCTRGAIPPVPHPVNDIVTITADRILYGVTATGGGGSPWMLTVGNLKGVKTFDIKQTATGPIWLGIYELKGDTLRVCFTPNTTRPSGIEPTKAMEYLQTFRRRKP
jgi:uncharacterized protein (TIGR03067 family)